MLGGVSWGVCSDALREVGPLTFLLFFFYVTFTMLAVMNIITGVFVDNAVETARTQREFLVQKEIELKEQYAKDMKKMFEETALLTPARPQRPLTPARPSGLPLTPERGSP